MCKHRDLILSRINANLNASPAAPAKPDKTIQSVLDQMEDRREYVAQQSSRCSNINPSVGFYPGYTPDELDDGRLDHVTKTGFVAIDELPDTHEEYVVSEDDVGGTSTERTFIADESPRSGGPASTRNYLREFFDRQPTCVEVLGKDGKTVLRRRKQARSRWWL